METLLARSGVGRASFSRHHATKDELVADTIHSHGDEWRHWLADQVATRGGDPLAVLDALADLRTLAPGKRWLRVEFVRVGDLQRNRSVPSGAVFHLRFPEAARR